MKKRDIQMIVIVLGTILFLVFLISLLFKALNVSLSGNKSDSIVIDSELGSGKSDISKEDREKIDKYTLYMENAYTSSLTVEQRKAIIDFIDDVINAINTKNYTLLYSKLDYLYVDAMFPTQEEFNEYVETITYGATDYTCMQYNAKYYGYECILTSKSQNTTVEIQISPLNEFSDYELSFRKDLVDVNERLKSFYVSGLSGMIIYEFECANTLEYIGTIRNTTKKSITCNFGESTAESYFSEYKLISPSTDLTIPAGETKDITFVFDVGSTVDIRPNVLNLSCKIGEKVEATKVYVDTLEDDIGI